MRTPRRASFADVVNLLEPGTTVFLPGLSGESLAFFAALQKAACKADGVRFAGVHFPGVNQSDYIGLHPNATQRAYFMQPHLRTAIEQARVELMQVDYPGAVRDLRQLTIDVAVAQVSPPDDTGVMSLGATYDFLPEVWQQARIKVAHVNPRVPRTLGSFHVQSAVCDWICESDAPLVTYGAGPLASEWERIGQHVADLVRPGDILQLGIGKLQSSVLRALAGHENVRIHSGMVTDAVLPLIDTGVIAGERAITTGVALGDAAFYRRLGEDRTFYFRPVSQTHDVRRIVLHEAFVAINAALEIDLFGQVNCDALDGRLVAGVGGMPAFLQGAQLSARGRAVFCLASTAAKGTVSRIVPTLGHGSFVAAPRHAADIVVTEHGVAHLRGLSLHARAERLIELAAPAFRDALSAQWAQLRQRL